MIKIQGFLSHFPGQTFANGVLFFFLEASIGFVLYIVYLLFRNPSREVFTFWRGEWKWGLMAGLFTICSYGLICVVLQFESVSAVVSLRQTSVLMVVYWGCWRLGEPFGRQRSLAGGLIVLGVMLIGL